ncbi:MAG: SGNH/GDSL hydrolase family protein [Candidatus Schekmanbacteria bacterium]|nr:SGNH/GDSL hydrolase family protein [Candidatus Schekmanbacteria bacterium]
MGLSIALLAGEAGLRLLRFRPVSILRPDIRKTYRLEPGAQFHYRGYLPGNFEDFDNLVTLNRHGFHDRDYSPQRPVAGAFRLVVLGDSYVAAFEVPIEDTFHKRLEARLGAEDPFARPLYEVIALGLPRKAQADQLQWLRQFGPAYQPDAVLLLFFSGNDILENSPALFGQAMDFATRYMATVVPAKIAFFDYLDLVPGSRLGGFLAETATTLYARNLDRFSNQVSRADLLSPELGLYADPLAPGWREAWERTASLLAEIAATCERLGATFLVAGLSGPQAIGDASSERTWSSAATGALDLGRGDRWIAAWTKGANVPFLHLTPTLSAAGPRRVFWRHDAHLTAHGHAIVAAQAYDFAVKTLAGAARARP